MSNIDRLLRKEKKGFLSDMAVSSIQMENPSVPLNGKGTVYYTGSYDGYYLKAVWRDGKRQGDAYLYSNEDVICAELTFRDDEVTGPCILYSENYRVAFCGSMDRGVKHGIGREFDDRGNVVFAGAFEAGVKVSNLIPLEFMPGFYEERSIRNNHTISIAQYNEKVTAKNGLCYEFRDDRIFAIYDYVDNERCTVHCQFNGRIMTKFDEDGCRRYEGAFEDSIDRNYPRSGEGKEFAPNGTTLVYRGEFIHDKRSGYGLSFQNNQCLYDGSWQNDFPNGYGVYYANGSILYKGEWHFGYFSVNDHTWFDYASASLFPGPLELLPDWSLRSMQVADDNVPITISVPCPATSYIVRTSADLHNVPSDVENIAVPDGCCSDPLLTSFVLRDLPQLHGVFIGDNCLQFVVRFDLSNLPCLERIVIGDKSFTSVTAVPKITNNNEILAYIKQTEAHGHSFRVTNCPRLDELLIGCFCFFDFDVCEVADNERLRFIRFGEIWKESYCFNYCPELKLCDLAALEEVELGPSSFCYVHHLEFRNLPVLKEIRMSMFSFYGDYRDERKWVSKEGFIYRNKLIMKSGNAFPC